MTVSNQALYKPLTEQVSQDLTTVEQLLSKHLADTDIEQGLESYQLASLLLFFYSARIISDLSSWVELAYNLEENHVIVDSISPDALKILNLSFSDECYFYAPASTGTAAFFKTQVSRLKDIKYPKYFRQILGLIRDSDYVYSLLNFVCGCLYWDSANMYHLILGRKAYILNSSVLRTKEVNPLFYLPDVPDTAELDDFLSEFYTLRDIILEYGTTYSGDITIHLPQICGIIEEGMLYTSGLMATDDTRNKYELAQKYRAWFSKLHPLAEPQEIVDTVYYDYGINYNTK